jgi:GDP-L-fucose synthase
MIVLLTGFKGNIIWDTTQPDGQPRRSLDTTRAYQEFGFKAKENFSTGLKKTIAWYIAQQQKKQVKA